MIKYVAWCILLAAAPMAGQVKTVEAIKGESLITYMLRHPLHHIEANSPDGRFRVTLDPTAKTIKTVTASVDVMTFDSGNSNRDSHAMEVVEALLYPDVSFTSTGVSESGDSIHVAGALTFHGITKNIVMAGTEHWSDKKLDVDGEFTVSLTEFHIERPALLLIPVDDALKFVLKVSFPL